MGKRVEVRISPYIPLSPNPSSARPVNGYFGICFQYGREETVQTADEGAYRTPSVTISGFVKEKGDTTAIFNTSDEFAAFVRTLQFEDTKMYENWTVEKADERNVLKIRKKTAVPPEADFVCAFHSLRFNPTNLKGDDARAVLQVKAEGFFEGVTDIYEITAAKIYVTDILSFKEVTGSCVKKIGEEFTLSWSSRGDYVQAAQLQEGGGEPEDVDVNGSRTIQCRRPQMYKLTVESQNPGARFMAAAYVEIQVSEPVITSFKADKKYVYAGEQTVLSWETESVYGCQINGDGTMYAAKDSVTVSPDFTAGEDTRKAKYRLDANGYCGKDPQQVHRDLVVYRTFWEKLEGELRGIDLSGIKAGRTEGIFFDGDRYYVFDGKQLLVSEDGLSYEKLSDLSMGQGYTLNEKYRCGFYQGRFFVAGVQSGDNVYIAYYEVSSGSWNMVFASGGGEKFLNGCFCPDLRHGRLYYVFFVNKTVYIYEEVGDEHSWTWTGRAVFDREITVCGCCCRENQLYIALLFKDQKMESYSIEIHSQGGPGELVKQSAVSGENGNIILMNTDNRVLILGEQAVYDAASGNMLDIGYRDKILAGMDESPVIVCREKDGCRRYRLHTDENSMTIMAGGMENN